jgi:hypothetical protein
MQVMSLCRSEDLGVTVQDIIQCKSIVQLAERVTLPEIPTYEEEIFDIAFDLSPIQKLYFECVGDNWSHFNQSVALRLTTKHKPEEVDNAIQLLVKSHSMLRARFEKNKFGIWQQRVPLNSTRSYYYNHRISKSDDIPTIIAETQKRLDIQNGPTFAVNYFDDEESDSQVVSLVAHHLVSCPTCESLHIPLK